jgi:hypothetical protein
MPKGMELGTRDSGLETREGAHYARVIYRSNNRKLEGAPQNERVAEASLRAHNPRHDT